MEILHFARTRGEEGPDPRDLASNAVIAYMVTMSNPTPSQALRDGRDVIRELAARHRTVNPRVYGSVVMGRDTADSDLDLLVETTPETTLFDLGGLQDALEEVLRVRIDVKTPFDLPPHIRERVLSQAVPV